MSLLKNIANQAKAAANQTSGTNNPTGFQKAPQAPGTNNPSAFQRVGQAVNQVTNKSGGKGTNSIVFNNIPTTQAAFVSLPQAAMQSPYDTAAMFVVALNVYPRNPNESIAMMNFLKGPQPLSARELSLLQSQMGQANNGAFLAQSYFAGATPENNYMPSKPLTVVVSDNPYSWGNQGYAKLFVACGGADSPRPITLRLAQDGKWYLWEHMLLSGIKQARSSSPWA